jgi:hypothetical protein
VYRRHDPLAGGGFEDAFARSKNMPRLDRAIPLVISGGSALPEGFATVSSRFCNGRNGSVLEIVCADRCTPQQGAPGEKPGSDLRTRR